MSHFKNQYFIGRNRTVWALEVTTAKWFDTQGSLIDTRICSPLKYMHKSAIQKQCCHWQQTDIELWKDSLLWIVWNKYTLKSMVYRLPMNSNSHLCLLSRTKLKRIKHLQFYPWLLALYIITHMMYLNTSQLKLTFLYLPIGYKCSRKITYYWI